MFAFHLQDTTKDLSTSTIVSDEERELRHFDKVCLSLNRDCGGTHWKSNTLQFVIIKYNFPIVRSNPYLHLLD